MARIQIYAKCNDCFHMTIHNDDGEPDIVKPFSFEEYDGYVPPWLSPDSDAITFSIDSDSGQILGWESITKEQVKETIESKENRMRDENGKSIY